MHVFVDGEHVVRHGHVAGEVVILADAVETGQHLGQRTGFPTTTGWPLIGSMVTEARHQECRHEP